MCVSAISAGCRTLLAHKYRPCSAASAAHFNAAQHFRLDYLFAGGISLVVSLNFYFFQLACHNFFHFHLFFLIFLQFSFICLLPRFGALSLTTIHLLTSHTQTSTNPKNPSSVYICICTCAGA